MREFLDIKVDAELGLQDQLAYVGAEFRKWVQGLPKGFKGGLSKIKHHGGHIIFRYEAMDSRV